MASGTYICGCQYYLVESELTRGNRMYSYRMASLSLLLVSIAGLITSFYILYRGSLPFYVCLAIALLVASSTLPLYFRARGPLNLWLLRLRYASRIRIVKPFPDGAVHNSSLHLLYRLAGRWRSRKVSEGIMLSGVVVLVLMLTSGSGHGLQKVFLTGLGILTLAVGLGWHLLLRGIPEDSCRLLDGRTLFMRPVLRDEKHVEAVSYAMLRSLGYRAIEVYETLFDKATWEGSPTLIIDVNKATTELMTPKKKVTRLILEMVSNSLAEVYKIL